MGTIDHSKGMLAKEADKAMGFQIFAERHVRSSYAPKWKIVRLFLRIKRYGGYVTTRIVSPGNQRAR